ncbi:MAG: hypothetical protein ACEQSB_00910 [Undibacterium sp.]
MEIFTQTVSFLGTALAFFFLPGFLIWRAVYGRAFSVMEELFLSFLASITLINLAMLILGRFGFPLSAPVVGGTVFFITLLAGSIAWKRNSFISGRVAPALFSPHTSLVFFVLLALTFFIRTIFFGPNILPTATDLGHHMYWSAVIADTEALPRYEKIEVATDPATGTSQITAPRGIADFIIGEHLPFAFFHEVSGLAFTGAFPILFLNLINILSVLAVTLLAYRLAAPLAPTIRAEWVALAVLLLLGPLFALASPQAKFVSGGVVGNLFGNLFIPAILLLAYRGLSEMRALYVAGSILFAFSLAYTHHLSTLVLAFVLLALIAGTAIALARSKQPFIMSWLRLLGSPVVIATLGAIVLFMILIALPTYLDKSAIDSAIGTPTKATRTGLSFLQISNSIGAGKVALGCIGILIGLFLAWRRPIEGALIAAWGAILMVMALFPQWLFLDIPSARIGSYLAYPLALAGGFALAWFVKLLFVDQSLPKYLSVIIIGALGAFVLGTGSTDNASSLTTKDRSHELVQTFAATEYLARHADGAPILKDHNYLSADAWMKLFFLRDYGYPLSRGLFGRYEEGGNRRERCTLAMISTPNTEAGVRCYDETGVRYLVVNPIFDATQFEKSDSFSKLYTSETAAIYQR